MVEATLNIEWNQAFLDLLGGRGRDASGRLLAGGPARRAVQQALAEWVVSVWHKKLLPVHFTARAPFLYPDAYTPRTRKYIERKKRKLGHARSKVFSGSLRKTILGSPPFVENPRPRRDKLAVRVRLPNARVLNLWSGRRFTSRGVAHDFTREMAAMGANMQKSLVRFIEKRASALLGRDLSGAGTIRRSA